MNVLHITSWYPHAGGPQEAPFVQRHVKALGLHGEQAVWHIAARLAPRWGLDRRRHLADRTYLLGMPLRIMFLLEWLSTFLILWAWITRERSVRIDAINFCIAYPNCVNIGFLRFFMRRPMLITEHYSAYRINFNSTARGIDRIRSIFSKGIPVVCVSRSLADDIARFAGHQRIPFHIVPNVVEETYFHYRPDIPPTEGRFFALAYWRTPKRLDVLLEAVKHLQERGRQVQLRIGGVGVQLDQLRPRIRELGISGSVELLGELDSARVAGEMRQAHAFLHASDHETYGAVCAEALGCGTPLIASRVGGIPEYLDPTRGHLVESNDALTWAHAIDTHWEALLAADRAAISTRMLAEGSTAKVGRIFHGVIASVVAAHQRGGRPITNDPLAHVRDPG